MLSIIFAVIFEIVFWAIFIGVILRSVRRAKLRNTAAKITKNNYKKDAKDSAEPERYVPKYYYTYCDFCGAKVSKGDKKCPECKVKLNNK